MKSSAFSFLISNHFDNFRQKYEKAIEKGNKHNEELRALLDSESDQKSNINAEIEFYKNREKELEGYKINLTTEIDRLNDQICQLKTEIENYRIRKYNYRKIYAFIIQKHN